MDTIIGIVTKYTESRQEEDFVDRLNYKFTSYLFCFGTLLITSKLYLGTPIQCWTPAEFRKGWSEYATDYCLIENTYYVPLDQANLPSTNQRENSELPYYQWVQFVLVLLAFCFYLPHLFWRSVNWQSGVQVRSIVSTASKLTIDEAQRAETVEKVAAHINIAIANSNHGIANKSNPFMIIFARCFGNKFLTYMYLFTKVLFLINIAFCLTILHLFLGFSPLTFFDLKLGFNTNWKETGLFPRSTMCDFEVRTKGNIQRYSVQCVLQLNMFNEKIFVVLYWWLLALFTITMANLVMWIVKLFQTTQREEFAIRMLKSAGVQRPRLDRPPSYRKGDDIELKTVTGNEEYNLNRYSDFIRLSPDQILLLRLISSNAGDIAASDITAALYRKYAASS